LPDVDVPGAEFKRPRHRLPLILDGCACQINVHLVRAVLLPLGTQESHPKSGVVARHERDAVDSLDEVPTQDTGPEAPQAERVARIEAKCNEVAGHPTTVTGNRRAVNASGATSRADSSPSSAQTSSK
jgi:hypothetical protein